MGDIIDARPDRFLRAMRETGDWDKACEQSGMTTAEIEEICRENSKYDLAIIECQLEFVEEQMIEATEKIIEKARQQRTLRLAQLRETSLADFHTRHPEVAING